MIYSLMTIVTIESAVFFRCVLNVSFPFHYQEFKHIFFISMLSNFIAQLSLGLTDWLSNIYTIFTTIESLSLLFLTLILNNPVVSQRMRHRIREMSTFVTPLLISPSNSRMYYCLFIIKPILFFFLNLILILFLLDLTLYVTQVIFSFILFLIIV